jgi:hypothetical protein
MKNLLYIFFVSISLASCVETTVKEDKSDLQINYWNLSYDTAYFEQNIKVDNDEYILQIKSYSKNDSLLTSYDSTSNYKIVGHNSVVHLLLKKGDSLVLDKVLTRENFKDSMDTDFYNYSLLTGVNYESVRSNRIYCQAYLCMPDSDFCYQTDFAIFFQTEKKGQIDYWNFKLREYDN